MKIANQAFKNILFKGTKAGILGAFSAATLTCIKNYIKSGKVGKRDLKRIL